MRNQKNVIVDLAHRGRGFVFQNNGTKTSRKLKGMIFIIIQSFSEKIVPWTQNNLYPRELVGKIPLVSELWGNFLLDVFLT